MSKKQRLPDRNKTPRPITSKGKMEKFNKCGNDREEADKRLKME
jgi:hypothetical protein